MNANILNKINYYKFIFDVPIEMEIQDDLDKMIKKEIKLPSPLPPYTPLPELMGKIEIHNLRQQLNEEFLRTAIAISKIELDTANKRPNEKNKELIKSIINPTPNLLIETKIKSEDKNILNNIKKNYVLPLTMRNRLDDIIDENKKKIYFNLHQKKIFVISQLKIFILMMILLLSQNLKQKQILVNQTLMEII